MSGAEARAFESALGDGARDALADLAGEDAAHARRALHALSAALGEDDTAPDVAAGLPADYTVLGVLGRGASGVVYRARQESLGREVAVKVLLHGGDAREAERLIAEARRLAALVHPSIVAIHEVGRAGSGVYLTLELQPGGSLQSAIAGKPLNPARAARIARQVADALAFTHSRGVVHLDLKPGNVLLDAEGDARVADFGLAREVAGLEVSATSGGLLGTPAFMAPEQAADRRDRIGERTDVYGLGALLWACLAGRPPFAERSLFDTLRAVREEEPEPLSRLAPHAPRDLVAIALMAMAKRPEERYPTARALSQDLERFEAGEPVEARLPGLTRRVGRRLRRNAREIAIATLGSLAAVLAMLPFRSVETGAEAGWLEAADELLEADERRAALVLLDRLAERGELSVERAGWLESLRARALGVEASAESRADDDERLGLAQGDLSWLDGVLEDDWLDYPERWLESPLDVERAWRALLTGLGRRWNELDPEQRERALRIAGLAPQWRWDGALEEWLGARPGAAEELVLAAAAATAPPAGPIEILVDVFVLAPAGDAVRVASHRDVVSPGESLRFEGTGVSGLLLPNERAGADSLRVSPPGQRPLRTGNVAYEIEGVLEALSGGSSFRVEDCETKLGAGGHDGEWFLERFGDGLVPGRPGVLLAHSYEWEGEVATVLMLGEASARSGAGETRALDDWRARFAGVLEQVVRLPVDPGSWGRTPPLTRAGMLQVVQGAALLGGGVDGLRALERRCELAGIEPAALSDAFCERGTFTGVTTAGGDLAFWLARGLVSAGEPVDCVRRTLAVLPRPGSASSRVGELSPKVLFFSFYVAGGLALLVAGARSAAGSERRRQLLGWALLIAAQGLDKTMPHPLGSLPWDPIALAIMAWSAFLLVPWGGSAARAVGACLALACAQELLLLVASGPTPRVPLACAYTAMAGLAVRVLPFAWYQRLRFVPLLFALLYVPAALLPLTADGLPDLRRVLFLAVVFSANAVMLFVALAGTRREPLSA